MNKLLLPVLLLFAVPVVAQQPYWQQELSYTMKATLNDNEKSILGEESIVYKNNSPHALDFIWFHIWPNAYKNENTALIKQIKGDSSRSRKMENFGTGYIDGLAFTADGQPVKTEPHPNPQYIDIIKVVLNKPLEPGAAVTIATPFKVKLPPYFSRSGYAATEIMACQWYPKPAVYDKDGWHEMPYLDMGEFYSEYATYSVSLTVPAEYVVSATGTLQTKDELAAYKRLGSANAKNRTAKPELYKPAGTGPKTLQYYAEQVPDFAWFADKDFVIEY
ncbi:MAG: M1 family peptidase, partial [Chitinophagaceae bacterium]